MPITKVSNLNRNKTGDSTQIFSVINPAVFSSNTRGKMAFGVVFKYLCKRYCMKAQNKNLIAGILIGIVGTMAIVFRKPLAQLLKQLWQAKR